MKTIRILSMAVLALLTFTTSAFAVDLIGNTITANDTYTVQVRQGYKYSFAVSGTFGGGSLAIRWRDANGNVGTYLESPAIAAENWNFTAATNLVDLVLTGGAAPNLTITLVPAEGQGNITNTIDGVEGLQTSLNTKANLAGGNTISGTQTLTGQLELTTQAATTANSAVTRGLGDARYAALSGPFNSTGGSVGAVAHSIGAANTGIYGSAAEINIAIAGAQRWIINDNYILGVNPGAQFYGGSTIAANRAVFATNGDGGAGIGHPAAGSTSLMGGGLDIVTASATGASVAGTITVGAGVVQSPPASATPANNGQMLFEATSNTSITLKFKGTDSIVRSVVLTLAP